MVKEFIKKVKEQIWECTQTDVISIPIPDPFPKGFHLEVQYVFTSSHTQYNYFNFWLNRKCEGQPEEVILEYLNTQGPDSKEFQETMENIMDELNAYWTDDAVLSAFEFYKTIPIKDGMLKTGFLHFPIGASHEDVCEWFDSFGCCDTNSIRGTLMERRGYRAKLVLDAETVAKLAPLVHGTPDLTRYGIKPYSAVLKKEVTFDNGVTAVYQVTANSVVKPLSVQAYLSDDEFDWDDSLDLLDTFILHDDDGNDYFLDVVAEEIPRTMGDSIRSMNNEELAKLLYRINHGGRHFLSENDALEFVCGLAEKQNKSAVYCDAKLF